MSSHLSRRRCLQTANFNFDLILTLPIAMKPVMYHV